MLMKVAIKQNPSLPQLMISRTDTQREKKKENKSLTSIEECVLVCTCVFVYI